MFDKLKAFWNSLPHPVQGAIVLFGGASLGVIGSAVGGEHSCLTLSCWRQYFGDGFRAGVAAVVGLYLPLNRGPK